MVCSIQENELRQNFQLLHKRNIFLQSFKTRGLGHLKFSALQLMQSSTKVSKISWFNPTTCLAWFTFPVNISA